MGISAVSGGLTLEEIKETLFQPDGGIQIGVDSAGIEIHTSPGTTRDGETVDEAFWVEIYGGAIRFVEV